ncbi:MAG: hypothetical protein HPY53_11230 [Brevinematales bacterium]|nr:hypothetical protein [Brevinematales bacterium]
MTAQKHPLYDKSYLNGKARFLSSMIMRAKDFCALKDVSIREVTRIYRSGEGTVNITRYKITPFFNPANEHEYVFEYIQKNRIKDIVILFHSEIALDPDYARAVVGYIHQDITNLMNQMS